MKTITALFFLITATFCQAQVSQFGQATELVTTTNSGVLTTTTFTVTVPAISLSIIATNTGSIVTNTINDGLNVNGTQLIPATTFVYNAALMGTNFSTNWPGYQVTVTNYTFGQAVPLTPGFSNVWIK